jgi:anti-sigma regulatory factor (Ser/Thr protein kinase)/RimJ/RimL family protein N-acetyltransferase
MEMLRIGCKSENIAPAVAFSALWAQSQGLELKESQRWSLAIDELLTNIVLFAFQEFENPPDLELNFKSHLGRLELIVHEPGEPFDPDSHLYKQEEAIQNNHFEGAGLLLIEKLSDQFTYLNKGKSGKEFHLIKEIPHIHVQELPKINEQISLTEDLQELSIRPVTPADAESLSRLIFRTYGHTYPKEELYYPQKIAKALKNGQKLGVICLNSKGNAIGYFAVLKIKDSPIGEVAEAVVSPAYRGQGLMTKMMDALLELAQSNQLKGVFAEAITLHTASQRVNSKFNFVSTALLLNAFPSVVSKGFENSQKERLSVLIEYLPFQIPELRKIYLPSSLKRVIKEIYQGLNFLIEIASPPNDPEVNLSQISQFEAHLGPVFKTALLVLHDCGKDLIEAIDARKKSLLKKGYLTLEIDIPLSQSWAPFAIETLQAAGFFFAGLIPLAHHEQDYLRLQKCKNDILWKQVKIHSDLALQIRRKVAREHKKWNHI